MEDYQYFDEDALPDVVLLDAGENYSDGDGNSYFLGGGNKSNIY